MPWLRTKEPDDNPQGVAAVPADVSRRLSRYPQRRRTAQLDDRQVGSANETKPDLEQPTAAKRHL